VSRAARPRAACWEGGERAQDKPPISSPASTVANGHIGAVRVINSRGNSLGQRVRARPSGAGRGVERELRPSGAGRDVERELDTKQTAVF
jgi:hypothetical protein